MNRTFYILFVIGFGITILFLFSDEIYRWLRYKQNQMRNELHELEKEMKEEEEEEDK